MAKWRFYAQQTITKIEAEYKDKPYSAWKQALYEAYPFGQRCNHPYKIWCDEQRKALARHPESPTNTTDGLELFEVTE